VCLSEVSLKDTAWAFSRLLWRNILDLGGHDLAGGLGGGALKSPPTRFSFFVEKVSGSSWNKGRGKQDFDDTLGGGFLGVTMGVEESGSARHGDGVRGSEGGGGVNIFNLFYLL